MRPEGVIFDVDGVLFDTERLSWEKWGEVATRMGYPKILNFRHDIIGRNRADIRLVVAREMGEDFPLDEFLLECSNTFNNHLGEYGVPLKPGVRELLDFLKENNIPLALATSTGLPKTTARIASVELTDYFPIVVTGDTVVHSKPHPEIFQKAVSQLGTRPERTLAIEDSHHGVRSASGAGLLPVMVPDLIPCSEELAPLVWKQFDSLIHVREYLEADLDNAIPS